MKDIFVDNDAATNFTNPVDAGYKQFFAWLFEKGVLVVSQKLLVEYTRTCVGGSGGSNIGVLINHLTKTPGRLIKIPKADLDAFAIPKHIVRHLQSNRADHVHIKTVLLSTRKYAITQDAGLLQDINYYPGHNSRAVNRPEKIDYSG